MNGEQLAFYKRLEISLSNGEYLDIRGNTSYVFVYLYKLLAKWNENGFEQLGEHLIYVSELYKAEEKLSNYCLHWAYDCLLGLKEYEAYLEKTENIKLSQSIESNTRLNIQKKIGLEADSIDVSNLYEGRKSKFITNNQALYKDKIREVFSSFADSQGGWFKIFENWKSDNAIYSHTLFRGSPYHPQLEFKKACFYAAYGLWDEIKVLSMEAENRARKEMGIPQVGQGWISETELFRKLESEFSITTVIQHGKPSWLGNQHFDIWMPNWKIAVEYQGKQHFEPVEFFGGQESFMKTVERDKKKAEIAERNGVRLFAITENDNQEELIQSINKLIENRKILPPNA